MERVSMGWKQLLISQNIQCEVVLERINPHNTHWMSREPLPNLAYEFAAQHLEKAACTYQAEPSSVNQPSNGSSQGCFHTSSQAALLYSGDVTPHSFPCSHLPEIWLMVIESSYFLFCRSHCSVLCSSRYYCRGLTGVAPRQSLLCSLVHPRPYPDEDLHTNGENTLKAGSDYRADRSLYECV